MLFDLLTGSVGAVEVFTTNHRGFTPEEIAERAIGHIMHVGKDIHPAIRDQAEAFKADIRNVLISCMYEAIRAHNTTLTNRMLDAGHPELVDILR